jgi:hypothetical protein
MRFAQGYSIIQRDSKSLPKLSICTIFTAQYSWLMLSGQLILLAINQSAIDLIGYFNYLSFFTDNTANFVYLRVHPHD